MSTLLDKSKLSVRVAVGGHKMPKIGQHILFCEPLYYLVPIPFDSILYITRKCPLRGHCLAPPGRPGGQKTQEVIQIFLNSYFSLLAHTKKLLLVTFCDKT